MTDKKEEAGIVSLPRMKAFILGLDATLIFMFLLLLSPRLTGLSTHEWMGIAFSLPILYHLLLARRWVIQTTKRVLSTGDRRARVNYILNWVLFTLVVLEIVSGLAISQAALPGAGIRTINDASWRALHNLTLNWTVMAVGLHVAMNWEWIVGAVRRALVGHNSPVGSPVRLTPTRTETVLWLAALMLAAGVLAFAAYLVLGPPSETRFYHQDEIARFSPTVGHGLMQFAGESFLVALVAYVGRRWLHIKL